MTRDETIEYFKDMMGDAIKSYLDEILPKGEWIVNTGNSYIDPPYFCSECNSPNNWKAPYCEHCGAQMKIGD